MVYSQGWMKNYGLGVGYAVVETSDKGYLIAGMEYHEDYWNNGILIAIDRYGNIISKSPLSIFQLCSSIQPTEDGGYIVAGPLGDNNPRDLVLVKTDSTIVPSWSNWYDFFTGEMNWSYYGPNYPIHIERYTAIQTSDKGYLVCTSGASLYNGAFRRNISYLKLDSNGDTIWLKSYSRNSDITGGYGLQTRDGGYILLGKYQGRILIVNTDSYGDTLWSKTFGGQTFNPYSFDHTEDGGYIISGYVAKNNQDAFIMKIDSLGDTLWTKTYGSSAKERAYSVKQTVDGGFIITGIANNDIYLLKTDSLGNEEWTRTFGGEKSDYGTDVQQTADRGYIVTGMRESYPTVMGKIFVLRTDRNGLIINYPNEMLPSLPPKKLIKTIDILGRDIACPKKNSVYFDIYDDGSCQKRIIIE